MEKVIFKDLFVDDRREDSEASAKLSEFARKMLESRREDREASEFTRKELGFEYSTRVCKVTETGSTDLLWIPPRTIEKIRDYLKREEENQTSSLF